MQRPYEQILPLPAGSWRPAGAVNTAAAAAAVASAVVAAPPSVALNFRAGLVERAGRAGMVERGLRGWTTAGPDQTKNIFMCIYKRSEIQSNTCNIKCFMRYPRYMHV